MNPRLFLGAAFAFGLAGAPSAQPLPCTDGFAGEHACQGLDLLAHLDLQDLDAAAGNSIWAWVDPQTDREYALMGLDNGLAFVDVTRPGAPVYVGKLPQHTEPSIWRDMRVYDHYAFSVSEAPGHGMQVFDLHRLRDVDEADMPTTFTPDAHYAGVSNTHTMAVTPETGRAYLVGTDQCAGGLHILDVRNPLQPQFLGCFSEDGYTHETQCWVYDGPDRDYAGREICLAFNEDTVTIVDVTDGASPRMVARGTYPNPGYTHQGWFTEDQRYVLLNDELDETQGFTPTARTVIMDLLDLDNPEYLGAFNSPVPSIDHNLYIQGDRVYEANYTAGLRVLDISDVAGGTLREVAFFDTFPASDEATFSGLWNIHPYLPSGTLIGSDIDDGLFVLRPSSTTTLGLSRFDATADEGAADLTWVIDRNSGAPLSLQHRHEDGPYRTVATLDPGDAPEHRVEGLSPGRHQFRLVQLGGDGRIQVSEPVALTVSAPDNYRLSALYPDADRGTSRLSLTVAQPQQVHIELVDGNGHRVKTIFDGTVESGTARAFEVYGPGLPPGSYSLQVTGETFEQTVALDDISANRPGR
jgi:choice-of-anchor B domain-containing protein